MDDDLTITWSHGQAAVNPLAGMLRTARFRSNGRWVSPFAVAPWQPGDPTVSGQPGHVAALGAEFVCVPFGSAEVPADAPGAWQEAAAPADVPPHGQTAEQRWAVASRTDSSVRLVLDLPEPSPIARVEREIEGVDGEPRLRFRLAVHVRRAHSTSIGVHPIFRLPAAGESLRADVAFGEGLAYPGTISGGSGLIEPNAVFSTLDEVGIVDLLRLPAQGPSEEVVQLLAARSPVRLHWSNGDEAELGWDDTVLSSILLWHSDRFLRAEPWNSRYRGLGVEPIASAFDFSTATSTAANPIVERGHATSVHLEPGHPFLLSYHVAAKHVMNRHQGLKAGDASAMSENSRMIYSDTAL